MDMQASESASFAAEHHEIHVGQSLIALLGWQPQPPTRQQTRETSFLNLLSPTDSRCLDELQLGLQTLPLVQTSHLLRTLQKLVKTSFHVSFVSLLIVFLRLDDNRQQQQQVVQRECPLKALKHSITLFLSLFMAPRNQRTISFCESKQFYGLNSNFYVLAQIVLWMAASWRSVEASLSRLALLSSANNVVVY